VTRRNLDELAVIAGERVFDQHADRDAHAFELHVFLFGLRDVEAAEFRFRGARAGAELDAAVAQQIERGDAFGDARGMIDGGRSLDDAVSDADAFGALAYCGEKHFGGRGVRVFFEKVVLGGPDVVVAALIGEDSLFEGVSEERVFGIGGPGTGELVFVEAAKFHNEVTCVTASLLWGKFVIVPDWFASDRVRTQGNALSGVAL